MRWPAAFEDAEDVMARMAIGEQASLHGRTANDEVCRCLPGTLLPPRREWELARLVDESRRKSGEASRKVIQDMQKAAEAVVAPKLDQLESETKAYDAALKVLQEKARVLEQAAEEMEASFQKVKSAHVEGDCSQVVRNAKEDSQPAPQCDVDWQRVKGELGDRQLIARPQCKAGATTLDALREYAMPMELAALGAPAVREPAAVGPVPLGSISGHRPNCRRLLQRAAAPQPHARRRRHGRTGVAVAGRTFL